MLSLLNKSNDFLLNIFRQVKMVHCSINSINFFLKYNSFFINIVNKNSKLSKKICLSNGSHNIDNGDKNELIIIPSPEIISKQKETASVEANTILVSRRLVKELSLLFPAVNIVKWGNPLFLHINYVVPDASDKMNVHQQKEYKLY